MHRPAFFVMFAALLVTGCATVLDGTTQEILISTPGAAEVRCFADNGLRYSFIGNDTVEIERSRHPLVIDCYASGNRHIHKVVESTINPNTGWNVSNAVVPGVSYDTTTAAVWRYPDEIIFDFTGMKAQGYPLPDYHNKDNQNPYEQGIERYGPAAPRLSGEPVEPSRTPLKRRVQNVDENSFGDGDESGDSEGKANEGNEAAAQKSSEQTNSESQKSTGASKLPVPRGSTAEELTRSMNPSVFGQ